MRTKNKLKTNKTIGMSFEQVTSICRGCLATERRMVSAAMLSTEFKNLIGIIISPSDGLPQVLCYECSALLRKYMRFRNKVTKAHQILSEYVLDQSKSLEHNDLKPHLVETNTLHIDIAGIEIEQTDQQTNTIEYYMGKSAVTKTEDVEVKQENDNFEYEECPEADPLNELIIEPSRSAHDWNEEKQSTHELKEEKESEELKISWHKPDSAEDPPQPWSAHTQIDGKTSVVAPSHELAPQILDSAGTASIENNARKQHKMNCNDIKSEDYKEIFFTCEIVVEPNTSYNSADNCNDKWIKTDVKLSHSEDDKENVKGIKKHIANANNLKANNSHSQANSYKCDICSKSFHRKPNLRLHILTHDKPYKCDVCSKCFHNKQTLFTHSRKHIAKPYQCDVCSKCLGSKEGLVYHLRLHDISCKSYMCDICGKLWYSKNALKRHYRLHSAEKKFKCTKCIKAFHTKNELTRHSIVHTDEKPHKCETCTKSFFSKQNLDIHMRTHTGEKPFKCAECPKAFGAQKYLALHMRKHTGEKPYRCDVCLKCFSQRGTLNMHYRMHTKDNTSKDNKCSNRDETSKPNKEGKRDKKSKRDTDIKE